MTVGELMDELSIRPRGAEVLFTSHDDPDWCWPVDEVNGPDECGDVILYCRSEGLPNE